MKTELYFCAGVSKIEILRSARVKKEVPRGTQPLEQDLVGLAFSGGGIRSATVSVA